MNWYTLVCRLEDGGYFVQHWQADYLAEAIKKHAEFERDLDSVSELCVAFEGRHVDMLPHVAHNTIRAMVTA